MNVPIGTVMSRLHGEERPSSKRCGSCRGSRSERIMDCDETRHHLYIYLDGEASNPASLEGSAALRQCPPCEDGFVFEEHLKVRVRQGCREEVPGELVERLRTFLQGHAE